MSQPLTIEEVQERLREKAGVAPKEIKQKRKLNLYEMAFDDLKALEQKAQDWLLSHKHLAESKPDTWKRAKERYDKIVLVYTNRHEKEYGIR